MRLCRCDQLSEVVCRMLGLSGSVFVQIKPPRMGVRYKAHVFLFACSRLLALRFFDELLCERLPLPSNSQQPWRSLNKIGSWNTVVFTKNEVQLHVL